MQNFPIIIVTGANNGLGFGTCHRLLVQLSGSAPSDAVPQFKDSLEYATREGDLVHFPAEGLTLIMACRNMKRAEAAKQRLYRIFEAHVAKKSREPGDDGHARKFAENVKIVIHSVDLTIMSSVFQFTKEITENYPYISHLVCNAGVAGFENLHWPRLFKQIFTDPLSALTSPEYYLQTFGERSLDGLGWIWQSNLFGHYVIYRQLQPLLSSSVYPYDSRIIWTSSIEASRGNFEVDLNDLQLLKSEHAYETSKRQIDLISSHLDEVSLATPPTDKRIRHLIAHPSVCHTGIANALIGPAMDLIKLMLFYLARWLGSPNHPIQPFKAAISAVYLSLVPLSFVTFMSDSTPPHTRPLRFGAATDRCGRERVQFQDVGKWEANRGVAKELVERCDELYGSFVEERTRELSVETASERM